MPDNQLIDDIEYQGEPTGTIDTDNARVILMEAERVSRFR